MVKIEATTEISPALHRLVVKVDVAGRKSSGGLFIPDTVRDMNQTQAETGTVVSVGDTAFKDFGAKSVSPGQRILFKRYGGVDFEVDGVPYKIMNDEDVLAVLKEEETKNE
jgi:chaperonin GroES